MLFMPKCKDSERETKKFLKHTGAMFQKFLKFHSRNIVIAGERVC